MLDPTYNLITTTFLLIIIFLYVTIVEPDLILVSPCHGCLIRPMAVIELNIRRPVVNTLSACAFVSFAVLLLLPNAPR